MIYILGAGPGNGEMLTQRSAELLRDADVVAGSGRLGSLAEKLCGKKFIQCFGAKETAELLKGFKDKKCAVLFSGDTGFFSGAKMLLRELEGMEYEIIPGVSSISYFCAKTGESYDDAFIVSSHGRECNIVSHVRGHRKTIALLGENPCAKLAEYGFGNLRVYLGERLSYADEKISCGTVNEFAKYKPDPLSVIMIINGAPSERRFGIGDDEFIRGSVPMTKSEIRALAMSKLDIKAADICVDVGAGTGSVSVEMALGCPFGKVYAVERNDEGAELIGKNARKFKTDNIEIIRGAAPGALPDIVPGKAFIGGSGGSLAEIIKRLYALNRSIKIVITAVTLETVSEACAVLDKFHADYTVTQIFAARSVRAGGKTLMKAQNPVFVIG